MAERNDGRTGKARDQLQELLSLLTSVDKIELEKFSMEIGDLELWVPSGNGAPHVVSHPLITGTTAIKEKPSVLYNEPYAPPAPLKRTGEAGEALSSSEGRIPRRSSTPISRRCTCRCSPWTSLTRSCPCPWWSKRASRMSWTTPRNGRAGTWSSAPI
jgi:hypothetical protein